MTYRIHEHVPLASYTSFRIGGPARWLVEVSNLDEIRRAIDFAREQEVPFVLISGGTNVLVADQGYPGVVIRWTGGRIRIAGSFLYVEAGENMEKVIREASKKGLGGWESLAGIPGSVGGAVRGNAGAFGTEIKDVISAVRALNTEDGKLYDFTPEACEFEYRDSVFRRDPKWVIIYVVFELKKKEAHEIDKEITTTISEREKRHLQRVRAAGSFFKNPEAPSVVRALFEHEKKTKSIARRVPAGWLIEKVGGKGSKIGGAAASDQHPNYLVNASGDAMANDVLTLAEQLHDKVKEKYKISMEPEVSLVGFV